MSDAVQHGGRSPRERALKSGAFLSRRTSGADRSVRQRTSKPALTAPVYVSFFPPLSDDQFASLALSLSIIRGFFDLI